GGAGWSEGRGAITGRRRPRVNGWRGLTGRPSTRLCRRGLARLLAWRDLGDGGELDLQRLALVAVARLVLALQEDAGHQHGVALLDARFGSSLGVGLPQRDVG